ncbi:MAG: 1-aminocyclopropane-1-carboxylate deaminase/D-cysteine desulfhydrase [Wujia sp.]
MEETIVSKIGELNGNNLYIKREDLISYSFGGNKARKGLLFFEEIDKGGYDCVVTYGSSHSNHCRIISNMAAARKIPCYLIGPEEVSDSTYNSRMMRLFGAHMITVPVNNVHDTIEEKLENLRREGKKPYFIPGGGHGNIGTQAYVECYEEIKRYEEEKDIFFDYIFFASGTGTTQAGLVCGQLIHGDERNIIGISIARKNPRGRNVVIDSIHEYLNEKKYMFDDEDIQSKTIFDDDYVSEGYGKNNALIVNAIKDAMIQYGIPLDSTYTGKAFVGMNSYIQNERITGKNILFIHTGGTPLFFDDLGKF